MCCSVSVLLLNNVSSKIHDDAVSIPGLLLYWCEGDCSRTCSNCSRIARHSRPGRLWLSRTHLWCWQSNSNCCNKEGLQTGQHHCRCIWNTFPDHYIYGCMLWRGYRLFFDDWMSPAAVGTNNGKVNRIAPKLCTLPPTAEAFAQNVLRAHYQLAQWYSALQGVNRSHAS